MIPKNNLREKKNWFSLFTANFVGVFNDNFLKHCIIFIAVAWTLPTWLSQSQLISIVSAALVLPYLICSGFAGKLAVRYNKQKIFRTMKLIEIPMVIMACVAFYYQHIILSIAIELILGFLSCLYSPAKYSLIRDIGGEEKVSYGSGMIEAMAFLGILLGTVTASLISDHYRLLWMAVVLIGLAIIGYVATSNIKVTELPEIENGESKGNPIKFVKKSYQFAKNHDRLNTAVIGYSTFWLLGGMMQMNLIIHCHNVLHISNSTTGIVLAFAAIGIALGCAFVGKISKKRVRTEFVTIGLCCMSASLLCILLFKLNLFFFIFCIFVFAFFGGWVQVPCLAHIEQADIGRKLGDMMAYLNFITFLFVLAGTLIFSLSTMIFSENSYVVFGIQFVIATIAALFFKKKF